MLAWSASPLLIMGIFVALGLIVAYVIAARRARARGDASPVVSVTLTIAATYAVLALIGAVTALVTTLMISAPTLTVPVTQYWPLPLPGVTVHSAGATVIGGGFTEADLTIDGLSEAPRVLWALGQCAAQLVPAAVAALVAIVCFQLLRGAAFAPLVSRASLVTAVVVLVGGWAGQFLRGAAGSLASEEALSFGASTVEGYPDDFDLYTALPQPAWTLQLDAWPLAAALAFAALAAVFRYGARLQRDTNLLV